MRFAAKQLVSWYARFDAVGSHIQDGPLSVAEQINLDRINAELRINIAHYDTAREKFLAARAAAKARMEAKPPGQV